MNQLYYAYATMQAFFADHFQDRKDLGATAVEYGLMVGLIAVVIIAAVIFLGETLTDIFAGTGNEIADGVGDLDNTNVPGGAE